MVRGFRRHLCGPYDLRYCMGPWLLSKTQVEEGQKTEEARAVVRSAVCLSGDFFVRTIKGTMRSWYLSPIAWSTCPSSQNRNITRPLKFNRILSANRSSYSNTHKLKIVIPYPIAPASACRFLLPIAEYTNLMI